MEYWWSRVDRRLFAFPLVWELESEQLPPLTKYAQKSKWNSYVILSEWNIQVTKRADLQGIIYNEGNVLAKVDYLLSLSARGSGSRVLRKMWLQKQLADPLT